MSLPTFRLDGRLALINGSSAGIGPALARGLGRAGAVLVLNGRDTARLAQAARRGLQVRIPGFDATQAGSVQETVEGMGNPHQSYAR